MLCPTCFGKGMVLFNDNLEPCSECHGQGLVYCCDTGIIDYHYKGFPIKPEWVESAADYPIVFAEDKDD